MISVPKIQRYTKTVSSILAIILLLSIIANFFTVQYANAETYPHPDIYYEQDEDKPKYDREIEYIDDIVADFSFIPINPCQLETVYFTDETEDNGHIIVSWHWSFGDGSNSYDVNPNHVYNEPGQYLVTLTVNDHVDFCDSATHTITINEFNSPPVAIDDSLTIEFGSGGMIDVIDNDYDLEDGTPSFDGFVNQPEFGEVVARYGQQFLWVEYDHYDFIQIDEGSFITDCFEYRVVDSEGLTDTAIVTVTIFDDNDPPVADAGGPYEGFVGEEILLDGSESFDLDSKIASFSWSYQIGSSFPKNIGSGEKIAYTWQAPGEYIITLRVVDDKGEQDSNYTTLIISEYQEPEPEIEYLLCDSVDIGNPTDEIGHNLFGWGPIEPENTHGNYGGGSDDGTLRVTWYKPQQGEDDRCADADLFLEFGWNAEIIVLNVLDGIANDSFEVYANGVLVYSYLDSQPENDPETWIEHEINISSYDFTEVVTISICSTSVQWSFFDTYGQLSVSWIKLYGNYYYDPYDDYDEDDIINDDEDINQDGNPTNDDTDGDGTPNYLDSDDNDGPLGDSDGDGINNQDDKFPDDPDEAVDSDGDGIGDNADNDDDNDLYSDFDELTCGSDPLFAGSVPSDFDGDFSPDCVDLDDDNDGWSDEDEDLYGTDSLDSNDYPILNNPPIVDDILNQTIYEGENFAPINPYAFVFDVDNTDCQINWEYSGNIDLQIVEAISDQLPNGTPVCVLLVEIDYPDGWTGSETITFTATDPYGLSDSDNATFTVLDSNEPPIAITDGPYFGIIDENITFNASESYDPDGNIINYTWDFGDGNLGYGDIVYHNYSAIGNYTVVLTVKDDNNSISNDVTYSNITMSEETQEEIPPKKPIKPSNGGGDEDPVIDIVPVADTQTTDDEDTSDQDIYNNSAEEEFVDEPVEEENEDESVLTNILITEQEIQKDESDSGSVGIILFEWWWILIFITFALVFMLYSIKNKDTIVKKMESINIVSKNRNKRFFRLTNFISKFIKL